MLSARGWGLPCSARAEGPRAARAEERGPSARPLREHWRQSPLISDYMPISPFIAALRAKVGNDLLLLPSVSAIILDDRRRVLLQRASDDGKWYVIGGSLEPDEQPAAAVVREV